MNRLLLLLLALALVVAEGATAQPRIRLIDSTTKAWMPEGQGTVGLRFRNAGNQPLIVTNAVIRASANIFSLGTSFAQPKILKPGDTSYVVVNVDAKIAYEYFANVDLLSNDPLKPTVSFILRINDSIPPLPVRSLTTLPLKGGHISVNWQAPFAPSDGDTTTFYRSFIVSRDLSKSEEIYKGRDRSVTAKSSIEGDVFVTVLAYDDMGNRSVAVDTTWIDASRPRVEITHIDQQFPGLTEHIARGKQRFTVSIRDHHMKQLNVLWREPGSLVNQPITQFTTFNGGSEEHSRYFDWNTSLLRGLKELILISSDVVDNTDTTVYSFTISQVNGWPKRMFNHDAISSSTVLFDEGGRFILTGSDIANGAFRPNGHHFYYQWPLDVTRALNDRVITASADLVGTMSPEVITLGQNDRVLLMDMHGKILQEIGEVTFNEWYASILQTNDSSLILTGPAPIAIRGTDEKFYLYGATQAFRTDGNSAKLERKIEQDGIREKDRFVIADLDRDGSEELIHVHDNGTFEEFSIRNRDGKQSEGPFTIWRPTASYKGFFPSVGDIDGDEDLEIVIGAPNDSVYAYHHNGTRVSGYPVFANTSSSGRNQALIVDVNADGAGDIIVNVQDSIVAFDGKRAIMLRNEVWPIQRKGPGTGLLTIGDLNSDGYLELLDPPAPGDTSWVYLFDLNVRDLPGSIEWGTFQHDMLRSGNYSTDTKALRSSIAQAANREEGLVLEGKALKVDRGGALEIVDILGRHVYGTDVRTGESIDLSGLPSGIYFVRIDELAVTKIRL
jgi:hypothetical protein